VTMAIEPLASSREFPNLIFLPSLARRLLLGIFGLARGRVFLNHLPGDLAELRRELWRQAGRNPVKAIVARNIKQQLGSASHQVTAAWL